MNFERAGLTALYIFLLSSMTFSPALLSQCTIGVEHLDQGLSAPEMLDLLQYQEVRVTYYSNANAEALVLYRCNSGDYFIALMLRNNRFYYFDLPDDDLSKYEAWASFSHPWEYYYREIHDRQTKHAKPEWQIPDYFPVSRCSHRRSTGARCLRLTRDDSGRCWQHD